MEIGSIRKNEFSSYNPSNTKKGSIIKSSAAEQTSINSNKYIKQTDTKISSMYDDNVIYSQGDVDIAKQRQYNRTKVTEAMNKLLDENGIEVPQDTSLTFSISPYDYKLTVSGLKDEALTSRIEEVLNSGDNAKNLFAHIYISGNGSDYVQSEQLQADKCQKLSLYLEVKNNTGYDLRNCISKGDTFYAPDGTDVINAYRNSTKIPIEYRSEVISTYTPRLRDLAKSGFNSIGDLTLQIEYKNGALYDIGQKNGYGPGQTKWIDNLVSQYGEDQFVHPTNKVSMDSENPAIKDFLKQNGIELSNNTMLKFSYMPSHNFLSISGTEDTNLLSKLQFLFFQPKATHLLQYLSRTQRKSSFDASV